MNVVEIRPGWQGFIGAILCLVAILAPQRADALGTAPGDIAAYVVGIWGEVAVKSTYRPRPGLSAEGETAGATWVPAVNKQPLYLTDSLRTGRGRVRAEFTNGDDLYDIGPTVLNLGEHSQVALSEYGIGVDDFGYAPGGVIDLIRGQIKLVVDSDLVNLRPRGVHQLRVGLAVIAIFGTTLTVDYNPEREEVIVEVSEGEVVLTGPGGSRVIKSGQRAVMVNGEFPGGGPS